MSMTNQKLPSADPRRNSVRWLALVALVGALAAGCSNGKAKDKEGAENEKNSTVPVEVQTLKRAEMVAVYSGTAPIEAHEEATVVAKVGGEVRQIYVEEGDAVQPGQVLARLDGDRLRLTLESLRVERAGEQGRLGHGQRTLTNGPNDAVGVEEAQAPEVPALDPEAVAFGKMHARVGPGLGQPREQQPRPALGARAADAEPQLLQALLPKKAP